MRVELDLLEADDLAVHAHFAVRRSAPDQDFGAIELLAAS